MAVSPTSATRSDLKFFRAVWRSRSGPTHCFSVGGSSFRAVVPTLVVDKGGGRGRLCVHVRALPKTLQGRQGAPLLERGGELPPARRSGGPASGSAPGRDQRRPACGVVPGGGGGGRRFALGADGLVRGGSGGAGAGLRDGSGEGRRAVGSASAAVGRVLAGAGVVGSAGTGSLLGASAAAEPPGDALAGRAEDAGGVPAGRSGQRVAAAPALVRLRCRICWAPRRRCRTTCCTAAWTSCWRIAGVLRLSAERWETLFEARFDVLLYDLTSTYFESDPTFEGLRQFTAATSARTACRW